MGHTLVDGYIDTAFTEGAVEGKRYGRELKPCRIRMVPSITGISHHGMSDQIEMATDLVKAAGPDPDCRRGGVAPVVIRDGGEVGHRVAIVQGMVDFPPFGG